jgi:hypothetical protein
MAERGGGGIEIKICFEILVFASLYNLHSEVIFTRHFLSLVAILSSSHFLLRFGEKANVMPPSYPPPPSPILQQNT